MSKSNATIIHGSDFIFIEPKTVRVVQSPHPPRITDADEDMMRKGRLEIVWHPHKGRCGVSCKRGIALEPWPRRNELLAFEEAMRRGYFDAHGVQDPYEMRAMTLFGEWSGLVRRPAIYIHPYAQDTSVVRVTNCGAVGKERLKAAVSLLEKETGMARLTGYEEDGIRGPGNDSMHAVGVLKSRVPKIVKGLLEIFDGRRSARS